MARPTSRRPSSLRFKLTASLLVLGAFLGLGEGGARMVGPQTPGLKGEGGWTLLGPHPTRMWAAPPGAVDNSGFLATVNALGIRGNLPADPKPEGELRIMLLGDSSIFGHGVDDDASLDAVLEKVLPSFGIRAEVINLGIPGYSTEQTLIELDEMGWALQPDLLIVGNLWSDNDIGLFRDADLLRTREVFGNRVLGHSALFKLTAATIDRLRGGKGARIVTWMDPSDWPEEGTRRVPLQDFARNLDTIAHSAARRNVGTTFLALCNSTQINQDDPVAPWSDYFAAQEQVAAFLQVPLFQTCDEFRASGITDTQQLFTDGMHPSALGVRILSQGIGAELVAAGWPWNTRLLARDAPFPADSLEDTWHNFALEDRAKLTTPQAHMFHED